MKKFLAASLSLAIILSLFAGCSNPTDRQKTSSQSNAPAQPVKFSMLYSDNATLPFKADWKSVIEAQKSANAEVTFEVVPIADYQQKVSLGLNTGTAPEVILYQTVTKGELAALALNGAIAPISDYSDLTPNFNKTVKELGLEEDVKNLSLKDGKRYFMPALFDKPFYDGGLLIRQDLLDKFSLPAPKTFEDLYTVLKKFKEADPKSYPLTTLVEPRVLFRMTMPSFGISLGKNASTGTHVLSWDYSKKQYFAGATSDLYKQYLTYFARLYKEGLFDPEMVNAGDKWTSKMATGASAASWAYYDQIGGIVSNSKVQGIKFNMLPPLAGPAGAHHQPKSKTGGGALFTKKAMERSDFKEIVKAVDKMFYDSANAQMWCMGFEGETYTKDGDKITYAKEIVDSPNGVYKELQLKYGLGVDVLQQVWINQREMTKYDANYAAINKTVAQMDDAIQVIPPAAKFDDMQAEKAGLLQAPLASVFDVWNNDFITGKKSIDKDWATYVKEMESKGINDLVKLYNDHLK
ncbi:extracellular solute-binding protein [Paludicola sp. MB14-C6]|uniref:extracellular solute-binding protein n=1 Tax=Paludihabitans sp. MB14-C6 TaxID=3070656 RepID=UPI0027DDFA09|nr:extracellular solute-binding protein [Paludicola sp. MB14-C6]WMJ22113.1 extracellular solute-binding protein [Paludicola sp. MB14-C6]